MKVKAIHCFEDDGSVGLDKIPLNSLLQIKKSATHYGATLYVTLKSKTGVTASTTIRDIITNDDMFWRLGYNGHIEYDEPTNVATIHIEKG